jgi:curli production assembly/transport component CsgG
MVAVQTGEILLTQEATKTIASMRAGADVFRFLDMSTKAFEIETGVATNEPTNYAVRSAIEYALYEIIKQGENLGMWKFKYDIHEGM